MSTLATVKQKAQGLMENVMAKAVALAPDSWLPGGTPDPLMDATRHIGKPLSRIDGTLKVSGTAPFAAEFALDGMVYASITASTIAKGRIAHIDTAAATAAPGVVLVMTHANAPRLADPPMFLTSAKAAAGDTLPIMQDDRIHWNGQPVALVLAATQEQADHACSLLQVSYEADTAATDFDRAKVSDSKPAMFMGHALQDAVGDADAALAAAAVRIDAVYHTPRHNHNAIELHGVTVAWTGDTLHVHDASQLVAHTAWTLGKIFGIDEKQVVVTSPFVGGGFGGKCLWQHHVLAAAAAKLAQRPVRCVLSRAGVYRLVGGRSLTEQRVALGADHTGHLQALIHSGTTAKTANNAMPEPFILATRSAYAADTMKLDVRHVELDMLSNTFMRAPGESVGTFALESAMDELAATLALDPIELRMRNEPEKDPLSGLPFSSRNLALAYRDGAKHFGWSKRQATPRSTRDGEWWVGMGCATGTYPYYRMPGGAARITLTRDGRAIIAIAAHEMGMGTATAQTQVAAERLGLPLAAVTFTYGDSTLPGVVLAGGSQQTASIGAAVIAAFEALVKELIKLAGATSPLAGLDAAAIDAWNEGIGSRSDRARHQTYADILAHAQRDSVTVEAAAPMPFETQHWSMHSHSAIFCEARVNAVTGEPRVTRLLGSFDCGRILNPKTAASQFRGGMIMGLGMALSEETQFDTRNGRVMNANLSDYHVPVHLDVPQIDVIWTDIPDPHTPMGARGVGEIGITGTAAAVANAIYNATGKRVRDLPITLDKLQR